MLEEGWSSFLLELAAIQPDSPKEEREKKMDFPRKSILRFIFDTE